MNANSRKRRKGTMTVNIDQLGQIMPLARRSGRAATYIDGINKYMAAFDINTPLRAAHFLAQIAHESAELRYTEEIASGAAYEGRKDLGNTQKGDGKRFKGRGFIQITGRANYTKYAKFCGYDVVAKPELLARQPGCIRSACWFWQTHDLNAAADADAFITITKRINGGTNGLDSRRAYLTRAKKAFGI